MSLIRLVAFAEDGPWCLTGWRPRPPGRWQGGSGPAVGDEAALNPQPLPPDPEGAALLWQAIRLQQYASLLAGAGGSDTLARSLGDAAQATYEGWDLPRMPWLIVLRWLGLPPPPPPPWLESIGHAASLVLIGRRMGGEFGDQLSASASAVILDQLKMPQAA